MGLVRWVRFIYHGLSLNLAQIVKDFLYHCFQKDPNLRVTAKKLLRHPWMMSARKHLELAAPPPAQPRSTSPLRSASRQTESSSMNGMRRPASRSDVEQVKHKKTPTVYDEAVQRVQEWNEALNGMSLSSSCNWADSFYSQLPQKLWEHFGVILQSSLVSRPSHPSLPPSLPVHQPILFSLSLPHQRHPHQLMAKLDCSRRLMMRDRL